jgi:ABC-type enterobactin transport system permease subunit
MGEKLPQKLPLAVLAGGLVLAVLVRALALANVARNRLTLVACLIVFGAVLSGGFIQWLVARQARQRDRPGFFVNMPPSSGGDRADDGPP